MTAEFVDPIKRSRRENLSPAHQAILHWLPTAVYRQILREYDIAKAYQSVRQEPTESDRTSVRGSDERGASRG